jgi:hypothetical protein
VVVVVVEAVIIIKRFVVRLGAMGAAVEAADEETFWRLFLFFFIVFLMPFATFRHRTTALLPSHDLDRDRDITNTCLYHGTTHEDVEQISWMPSTLSKS